jgi:hypothetical protein
MAQVLRVGDERIVVNVIENVLGSEKIPGAAIGKSA